jgi:hypothetical protein
VGSEASLPDPVLALRSSGSCGPREAEPADTTFQKDVEMMKYCNDVAFLVRIALAAHFVNRRSVGAVQTNNHTGRNALMTVDLRIGRNAKYTNARDPTRRSIVIAAFADNPAESCGLPWITQ